MKRGGWLAVLACSLLLAGLWTRHERADTDLPYEPPLRPVEIQPLCPWRNEAEDLARYFPGADRWTSETRILSGRRAPLEKVLGSPLTSEESALPFHAIYRGQEFLGVVLTLRAKGEHGVIEIVMAVDPHVKIRGVRLQRLREPDPVTAALVSDSWLGVFAGKSPAGPWTIDRDVAGLAQEAVPSATAIAQAVRRRLLLWEDAHTLGGTAIPKPHH